MNILCPKHGVPCNADGVGCVLVGTDWLWSIHCVGFARAHAHTLFQPRNLFICQEIVMQPKTQELWCNYADVCTSTGRVGTPYLCIGHLLVLYSRA